VLASRRTEVPRTLGETVPRAVLWAVENASGLGRHLAVRLAGSGESVVDVPPKLSARVRLLSSGNARKNDELDALATALAVSRNERLAAVDPEAASEVLCACFPRGARTWWPSAPGRSRQPARAPAGPHPRRGYRNALGPPGSEHPARHTSQGRRLGPLPPAVGFGGAARRPDARQEDR
jgi:hypothetical protein